jgi:hypothetical protein
MRRIRFLPALVVAVTAVALGGSIANGQEADRPGRLLIYSMPGLTWAGAGDADVPVLDDFSAGAALANLAPRSVTSRSGPGAAYLTISAGSRAATDELVDGQVLEARQSDQLSAAGQVFARRTGVEPDGDYVALAWPELLRANADQPYDAVLGLLAETLDEEGVATAVIANADGTDSTLSSNHRQAGLALTGTDGVLAFGNLTTELLTADPSRPFGYRIDPDAFVESFASTWAELDEGVVLVEASDLARTMRYRPLVSERQYDELWAQAVSEADALLGRLLDEVDPERDSVLVVAPYGDPDLNQLMVAALRTPEVDGGYLRSASTQRAGIVTLVDVAPSILDRFGIGRPVEMEGQRFEVVDTSASVDDQREHLVSVNEASRFRENLLFPTTVVLVLALAVVAAFAAVVIAGDWSERARRAVQIGALATLAGLPMSYVARGFPLEDLGLVFYWTFLVVSSLAVAFLATALARRTGRPLLGLAAVLGLTILVLVVDVMTGSNLHLSAAFGYSPTGNSRLYGISNYSFGQLAAATSLVAAFLAATWPTRKGRIVAVGLMVAALIILGVPMWGSDVGGVLAFTPTVLLFAALLFRVRLRLRSLIIAGLATVAVVTAFGLADLARPAGERAHLGRLFARIGNEGIEPLLSIMERKLLANMRVSTSSFWVAAIPIGIAFWLVLTRLPGRPLDRVSGRIPTLFIGLAAAVVAAVLGSIVNDSGAIVGGVTVLVVALSLVYLGVEPRESTEAAEP